MSFSAILGVPLRWRGVPKDGQWEELRETWEAYCLRDMLGEH
jgi:hypothetical protein